MTVRGQLLVGAVGLSALSAGLVALLSTALVAPRTSSGRGDSRPPPSQPSRDRLAETAPETTSFPIPSGKPAALTCEQARRIVRQIRETLAYEPQPVVPSALATATADWLDPYGLWSAAPDSPIGDVLTHEGANLLRELEDSDPRSCTAAGAVSDKLLRWSAELGTRYDESRQSALRPTSPKDPLEKMVDGPLFEGERPARELATLLGTGAGRLEHRIGPPLSSYADAGRARFFPSLTREGWAELVRAAAVRAYLPLVDPHGAWASTDEQASIYDVDLDPHPPELLWDQGQRTALGVLVEAHPMDPLEVGDLVLAIGGMPLAGLPPEQLDQLVYATTDGTAFASLVVLRPGEDALRTLSLAPPADAPDEAEPPADLEAYRVRYGDGDAVVVEIHDVRADLDLELAATLRSQSEPGQRPVEGLLLDLRGNGGGSAEGAIGALGAFLPGAPLFPMVERDGSIEVDRAPVPAPSEQWTGAVAALVDGDTASAAEMIAGALMAYGRGPVVGERTFGKGCAQEYLDDQAGVGVLRLTTLLYALPDGAPVQRVGLLPSVLLPKTASSGSHQREADEPAAPPTWRGPDVRDPALVLPPERGAWPEHHGKVGAATDPAVTAALRALGNGASGVKRSASAEPAATHLRPAP